jgi:hypothetical protein
MNKFLISLFLIVASFFLTKDVFAMDIPVFSLIVSENSSGYICPGDSIGCSSLSSIYKVEKRGEDIYVCPGGSIGGCSPLDTLYKTSKYSQDTTYVCSSNSFGSCSAFNVLYKISKHDESTSYICPGDSIGNCSIFNVLYKISKYDTDTTFACPGDSIGNCSIFNVLYKFKKTDTQSSGYSGTNYNDQIKAEQDKLAQLEQEEQKLTESYLNALNNLNAPQYTCPSNLVVNGDKCVCNDGYTYNGSTCITYTQNCQAKYGVNSYGDKSSCTCTSGYVIYNNQCILGNEYCRLNYGDHALVKMINGVAHCDCEIGYIWNSSQTTCFKAEVQPIQPLPTPTKLPTEIINPLKNEQKEQAAPIIEKQEAEKVITNEALVTSPDKGTEEKDSIQQKQSFLSKVFGSIKSFFSRIFKR